MTANIIMYSIFGNGHRKFGKKYNELQTIEYGSTNDQKIEFLEWVKKLPEFRVIEVLPNETIEQVLEGEDYYNFIVIYTL